MTRKKFIIQVVNDVREYICYEGDRLLHSVEGVGGKCIKVGCREGGCGVCRVKVLSGEYSTGVMSKHYVSENEAAEGYALSCRIYPESDMTVEPAPKPIALKRKRLLDNTREFDHQVRN